MDKGSYVPNHSTCGDTLIEIWSNDGWQNGVWSYLLGSQVSPDMVIIPAPCQFSASCLETCCVYTTRPFPFCFSCYAMIWQPQPCPKLIHRDLSPCKAVRSIWQLQQGYSSRMLKLDSMFLYTSNSFILKVVHIFSNFFPLAKCMHTPNCWFWHVSDHKWISHLECMLRWN